MKQKLGDELLSLSVLIWVSVSVGPWWVGALLFLGAFCINLIVALGRKEMKP